VGRAFPEKREKEARTENWQKYSNTGGLFGRLFRASSTFSVRGKIMAETTTTGVEQDERHAAAVQIALEVGLLEKCDVHGCVYDSMNDFVLDDAFRCGEELITQNDPSVAVFQGNRKRLRHAIEDVRSGMPNSCPDCYYAQVKD
jgi:hypothetical protein